MQKSLNAAENNGVQALYFSNRLYNLFAVKDGHDVIEGIIVILTGGG